MDKQKQKKKTIGVIKTVDETRSAMKSCITIPNPNDYVVRKERVEQVRVLGLNRLVPYIKINNT